MSKFSEYLRNLINESGESISAISRSIGAERTSIHKALSDERVLPYKVVQNLARHFNLSLDELVYQNLENQIHEEKGPYTPAIDVKSGNMLYLTKEETQLLLKFRNADADTRLLLEKLLF